MRVLRNTGLIITGLAGMAMLARLAKVEPVSFEWIVAAFIIGQAFIDGYVLARQKISHKI